jgi:hypothetical protein
VAHYAGSAKADDVDAFLERRRLRARDGRIRMWTRRKQRVGMPTGTTLSLQVHAR